MRLHFIYASTSGNTEFVVDTLVAVLKQKQPEWTYEKQLAEQASREDLQRCDALILGSGTWNYQGSEGQLNQYMHELLFGKAEGIDLQGKHIAFISLGDERYYYTTRCTEHFMKFLKASKAKQLLPPLVIVNEPYDQQERIVSWANKLVNSVATSSLSPSSL